MGDDAGKVEGFKRPKSRPRTRAQLERLVAQYSGAEGLAPARVRRWISVMAFLGNLERVSHDGAPAFIVKGGVAMELRIRLRARATKDVDLVFRGDVDTDVVQALLDALDEAFEGSYSGFTFRRKGEPEFVKAAISIEDFQLEGPESVPVLSLRYQIAQTLHAVTEQPDAHHNDRARDLIDLQLLEEIVVDVKAVRTACVETFDGRGRQPWPPDLVVQPGWDELYERLARELEFPVTGVEEAATRVRSFIAKIETAGP